MDVDRIEKSTNFLLHFRIVSSVPVRSQGRFRGKSEPINDEHLDECFRSW